MAGLFDNIHLGLDCNEAIAILGKDASDLSNESDYYMACSHLINFPSAEAGDALIHFLTRPSDHTAVRLAQRKAVEVLARLHVVRAQDVIANFLDSSDIYMVENAVWALGELQCSDTQIHESMIRLLKTSGQNQRVLIQTLSKLSVQEAIPVIVPLSDSEVTPVQGAALAALARLSGTRSRLDELSDHLYVRNQMDRQSAIQDVIDAEASQLLPSVLAAPISPAFRMRAVRSFLDPSLADEQIRLGLEAIDNVFQDDPRKIVVLHHYDESLPTHLLVEGLFHPDFSRCYLAMQSLLDRDPDELWGHLEECWHHRAYNDYGAHYFLMRLFGMIPGWKQHSLISIHEILMQAISDQRPQFKKSAPAAFLALSYLFHNDVGPIIAEWLALERDLYWDYRYVALMVIQSHRPVDEFIHHQHRIEVLAQSDSDWIVRCKAKAVLQDVSAAL